MHYTSKKYFAFILYAFLISLSNTTYSETTKKLNIVIHISSSFAASHQAALNYTKIIRGKYGDKANIVVVANGPGIAFVNSKNKFKNSIKSLHKDSIPTFACNSTIQHLIRNNKEIPIVEEVQIVPFGILKVIELQEKGYLYLRP